MKLECGAGEVNVRYAKAYGHYPAILRSFVSDFLSNTLENNKSLNRFQIQRPILRNPGSHIRTAHAPPPDLL
jgi:hypothetical protein